MKPIAIVDANALHGLKALTSAESKAVLALAKTDHVRLVIPDVVVHELARQGAKEFNDKHSTLRNAVNGFNGVAREASAIGVATPPRVTETIVPPPTGRSTFHDAMTGFLRGMKVETPTYPDVSVAALLTRDLDYRKPFSESGKGFRDALIWETIRELCTGLEGSNVPVIFVTKNHTDFCVGKEKRLHDHLRDEIAPNQRFDVVETLTDLLAHEVIKPLAESLRVADRPFTRVAVEKLVNDALTHLEGLDVERAVGVYDGDGMYSNPIGTPLADTVFAEIMPDDGTIGFEVFRTGDVNETTIRVTVEADCSIEGFIDKADFFVNDHDGFTYYEDWNRHMFRAAEPHRVRFTLSAGFTEATIDSVALAVDEAEDVRP